MNPDLLLRFARRFPIANLGPLWLVSSEAEIRQVLTSSDYGKSGAWDALAPLLGEGLILSEGAEHKAQRRQIAQAMQRRVADVFECVQHPQRAAEVEHRADVQRLGAHQHQVTVAQIRANEHSAY